MIMKIKLEKEEYADYIRSISPVFLKLLEMIIKKTQIVDLISLIRFDKKSGSAWVKETNKYVKSFDYIAIIDENGKGGIYLNIKKIIYKVAELGEFCSVISCNGFEQSGKIFSIILSQDFHCRHNG